MTDREVYHDGEIAVQERAGERAVAIRRGSIVADHLAAGMRAFIADQGEIAIAAMAADGSLWASFWCGEPGFISVDETGKRIALHSAASYVDAHDPVRPLLAEGRAVGLLAIDLSTRRRLRINGMIERANDAGIALTTREVFANCPKYIQRRERIDVLPVRTSPPPKYGIALDAERRDLVVRTDTLFVASIHVERGLDVSHRGGEPGFVLVRDERTLVIPDYTGNSMFQTLGNLQVDSRAGLALIDFDRHRVLSLSGEARLVFESEDARQPTGGTGRYWSFTIERWIEHSMSPAIRWMLMERSPFNPRH